MESMASTSNAAPTHHPSPGRIAPTPHVVIVGAGFAGLNVARGLARAPAAVTLIDRENHHLFQPLLYQVATAALSPANIAWPIRRLVRHQPNTRVLLGRVTGVDRARRVVQLPDREIPYDYLVLATGAAHSYFGNDHWAEHAPGLKSLDDATVIRRRLLLAFEKAEMEPDPDRRRCLLTFAVVGAGPTGVELAGAIVELARKALDHDFRIIDPRAARVVLVEAGPRVLAGFPDALSRRAHADLEALGVEVRLNSMVTDCRADGVALKDDFLRAGAIVWAAGVAASPAARWLGVDGDKAGRVPVTPALHLAGDERIYVIGDTALVEGPDGAPLPGIAPVAKQQGDHVARAVSAALEGRAAAPFRYRDRGQLATIGRRAAIVSFGRLRLRGRLAWWAWGLAHIYFLIGMRSRVIVATQWLWSYATFERGSRLITGIRGTETVSPTQASAAPAGRPAPELPTTPANPPAMGESAQGAGAGPPRSSDASLP